MSAAPGVPVTESLLLSLTALVGSCLLCAEVDLPSLELGERGSDTESSTSISPACLHLQTENQNSYSTCSSLVDLAKVLRKLQAKPQCFPDSPCQRNIHSSKLEPGC